MTASVREQILAEILTILGGITGFPGLAVERNLDAAVESFPTLVLRDGDEEADETQFQGACDVRMQLFVEGHVLLPGGSLTNIGTAANELYAAAEAALLADRTLGGLAVEITKTGCRVDVNRGDGQTPQAAFEAAFLVHYWHRAGDPLTAHA